jgi:hypothetical protein
LFESMEYEVRRTLVIAPMRRMEAREPEVRAGVIPGM